MNTHDAEILEGLLEKAPGKTQTKIRDLIDESAAAVAAVQMAGDARSAAIKHHASTLAHFRERYRDVEVVDGEGGPTFEFATGRRATTPEEAKPWCERVTKAAQQVRRATATQERAEATWHQYAFLSDLKDWLLDEGRSNPLKAASAPTPKLTGKQTHADAVDAIRAQLDELAARRHAVDVAPAPVADLVGRMEAEVDALATRHGPHVYTNRRDGSPVNVGSSSDAHREAFVFWALADVLKAEAAKKIREAYDGDGLGDFERAAELSALDADRLALERLEEAHIVAAAEINQIISRRREADPRAVLEVL